jgi:hypothetical protein
MRTRVCTNARRGPLPAASRSSRAITHARHWCAHLHAAIRLTQAPPRSDHMSADSDWRGLPHASLHPADAQYHDDNRAPRTRAERGVRGMHGDADLAPQAPERGELSDCERLEGGPNEA